MIQILEPRAAVYGLAYFFARYETKNAELKERKKMRNKPALIINLCRYELKNLDRSGRRYCCFPWRGLKEWILKWSRRETSEKLREKVAKEIEKIEEKKSTYSSAAERYLYSKVAKRRQKKKKKSRKKIVTISISSGLINMYRFTKFL